MNDNLKLPPFAEIKRLNLVIKEKNKLISEFKIYDKKRIIYVKNLKEENIRLKKEIENYNLFIQQFVDNSNKNLLDKLFKENFKLKDENSNLKIEINNLKGKFQKLLNYICGIESHINKFPTKENIFKHLKVLKNNINNYIKSKYD